MSPQSQFVCFLIGLLLLIGAAIVSAVGRAWSMLLLSAGLGFGFLVFVVNANAAM